MTDPIAELFSYHTPTADMLHRMDAVREAIIAAAKAIDEHCPAGPDRTAAMRNLKIAHMTVNSAIIHKGKAYR